MDRIESMAVWHVGERTESSALDVGGARLAFFCAFFRRKRDCPGGSGFGSMRCPGLSGRGQESQKGADSSTDPIRSNQIESVWRSLTEPALLLYLYSNNEHRPLFIPFLFYTRRL